MIVAISELVGDVEIVVARRLDLAPLPSGLDAIVIGLPEASWCAMSLTRRARLRDAAADYSVRTRRDVTWRWERGAQCFWCGPVARGGELHRELYAMLTQRARDGVMAYGWPSLTRTAPWPPAREHAPQTPLDEDDDDNAVAPMETA